MLVGPGDAILACNAAAADLLGVPVGPPTTPPTMQNLPVQSLAELARGLASLWASADPEAVHGIAIDRGGEAVELVLTLIRGDTADDGFVLVTAPALARSGLPGAGTRVDRAPLPGAQERSAVPVNDFLAMLAHELRNPLAPIVNALYIIRQRVRDDPLVTQALQVADRQVRHQARLLDDLLDTSRVLLGKISLHRVPIDLRDVLHQALDASRVLFQSRAQRVAVHLPDAPLPVAADSDRLEQVVRNLLSNAAKYTGPGGDVSVAAEREATVAVVRVRDTGIGITPDVLPRIFDLFFQGDSSLARPEGGLGVGLTLARHIVDMHDGTLEVRSEGRGRGSEFEMRLPLSGAVAASRAGTASGQTSPRTRRVLLIEDNRDARTMLRLQLELSGHQVEEARDGRTGITMASASAPDVVLIDVGLPDIDGYQVARTIRKRLGGHVRLIALTGYGDASARQRSSEAGFDRHLTKPVTPEHLAQAIDSA